MGKYKIEAGQVYVARPSHPTRTGTCTVVEILPEGMFKQLLSQDEYTNIGYIISLEDNIESGVWILSTPLIRELL
jgi:hypothetical protein